MHTTPVSWLQKHPPLLRTGQEWQGASDSIPLAANTHVTPTPIHKRWCPWTWQNWIQCRRREAQSLPLPPAVAGPMAQAIPEAARRPPSRCPRKQHQQQYQHRLQQSRASPEVQAAKVRAKGKNSGRGSGGWKVQDEPSSTTTDNSGRNTKNLCYSTTYWKTKVKKWTCESLSLVWLFMTPCTVAHQAPLFMEFSRQEYWRSVGDLPNTGIKPESPALQTDSLPSEPPGKP